VLGWASLGLGVPQTTTPGRFVRSIGVKDDAESRAWTLAVGVRELAAAAGILALEKPRPVTSLWGRVAGDAMDLALLGNAWRSKREDAAKLAGAIAAVVGIGVADVVAAMQATREQDTAAQTDQMHVRRAITVRRSRDEVYAFLRDFTNLPRFMAHLESVEITGDGRSHWKAKAPAGRSVEWDAEIVDEQPDTLIAWRSLPGAAVENSGSVRFTPAPDDRGTEIRVDLRYRPPGGALGAIVGKLFGEEPALQVGDDLRRFKQVMETGEVVRSEGTPEGAMAKRLLKQRPAQPLRAEEVQAIVGRVS